MNTTHPDPIAMEKALLCIAHGTRPSLQSVGRELCLLRPELRRLADDALKTTSSVMSENWNGPSPKAMEHALRVISRGIRPDSLLMVKGKVLSCYQLRAIARTTLEIRYSKRVIPGLYWKQATMIDEALFVETSPPGELAEIVSV